MGLPILIVPALRVVTPPPTLRVPQTTRIQAWAGDAERHGKHAHAERGNDHSVSRCFSGTGFSREALDLLLIFIHRGSKHRQSRLGCRLNADDAEWAERHGCRESAVRTWMSVRRGPTERRRSEGTPTQEGPNQEQAPLVTWGAFPSNSPKAKQSAPRQTLLILIVI